MAVRVGVRPDIVELLQLGTCFRLMQVCAIAAILLLSSATTAGLPLHFIAPRNFPTCPISSQILTMDLDADGDVDVAFGCGDFLGGYHLQLFENPGGGSLLLRAALALAAATRFVAADLDGDGHLDLAQVRTVGALSGELLTLWRCECSRYPGS